MLGLQGAYRPPLGQAGAALERFVFERVTTVTIRALIRRVADIIVHPAGAPAPGREILACLRGSLLSRRCPVCDLLGPVCRFAPGQASVVQGRAGR